MDFGVYPPEVNSGRMYAGPGAGPMLAAAQAWDRLADGLYTAAVSHQSVVAELVGAWSGPSSTSMAAAAISYAAWLSATAAQAEETANQANAAAAAYEAAFISTVPPPVVAANRSLLTALVATNFLGQNAAAIAATEAQYAEMWAQDAAAMYNYAASSVSATTLTPFTAPHQNTDPGAAASQAAAVSQATGTSAANGQNVVLSVPQVLSSVPNALQGLAAAAPAASSSDTLDTLSDLITIFLDVPASLSSDVGVPLGILGGAVSLPYDVVGYLLGVHTDDIVSGWNGEQSWPGTDPAPVAGFPAPLTTPRIAAGLGQANTVGGLSVPSAWTVAAPEIRPLALASPITGAGPTAAASVELGSSTPLSQLGLAGMTGRAMVGPPSAGEVKDGGEVISTRMVVRPGGAAAADRDRDASHGEPRIVVTGVAAKIRELAKLRNEGDLTEEEYAQLKKRLLGR